MAITDKGGNLVSLDPKTRSDWSCVYKNAFNEEYDLGGIIEQLSIYESIFNDCMFGNISLKDGQGFAERQALIGSGVEEIIVEIETTGIVDKNSNLRKEFRLNSYSDASYSSTGNGLVNSNLGFVSKHLIKSNRTKISRSFNAMTASDIVGYITEDILKLPEGDNNLEWDALITNEPTKNVKNCVIPSWTPFKTIKWLAKHSMSEDNGSSNYIFFENNEGFHFTSIDKLKEQDVTRTFTVGIDISQSLRSSENGAVEVRTDLTEKFENTNRFNHTSSQHNGLYGGKVFTHNILTKDYNNFEVNYVGSDETIMGGDAGLNGAGQFASAPDAHLGFMPDEYMYKIHDKKDKSHYVHRDMKMSELRTNIVKFDIAGNTNIWAGQIIEINVPSTIRENGADALDQYLSGNWLVTAIHHKINDMEYVMTLECMRDGFENMPE